MRDAAARVEAVRTVNGAANAAKLGIRKPWVSVGIPFFGAKIVNTWANACYTVSGRLPYLEKPRFGADAMPHAGVPYTGRASGGIPISVTVRAPLLRIVRACVRPWPGRTDQIVHSVATWPGICAAARAREETSSGVSQGAAGWTAQGKARWPGTGSAASPAR